MATVVARLPPMPGRSTTPPPHLTRDTSSRGTPAAIPNKHLPACSPGPVPYRGLETPPASPPARDALVEASSITHPPTKYCTKYSDDPPVFTISAPRCAQALEHVATQPLPIPDQVFPWLHGLHADNQLQLAFFVNRRKSLRRVPRCIRGLTVVKTGGDLARSKLKGAIAPDELLSSARDHDTFLECDPRCGFSVRNFHIQACKLATVSDIIVYGDGSTDPNETVTLARRISKAQRHHEARHGFPRGYFNTFMLSDPFAHMEAHYPNLVAVDSTGGMTGNVVDFFYWERLEMSVISKTSEISPNVFLGPTPVSVSDSACPSEPAFDVLIEASDTARVPDPITLRGWHNILERTDREGPLRLEFPSSGSILPPTWSHAEVDGLMDTCKWIYDLANPQEARRTGRNKSEDDEAIELDDVAPPRKILIHCADGYTETSMLGLVYFMYAQGLPAHDAYVQLHRAKGRNFFTYPTDVCLLTAMQPRILQDSPRVDRSASNIPEPQWLSRFDGSLPSRILPYMYLGNLGHANNPELLREIGVTRILSVGEPITWPENVKRQMAWPLKNLMMVDRVQDNGVDPLWEDFHRCLEFIEAGKREGGATLVHCRVGVSRSATICIAEVMNELGLSFPRAYCFVRARRLNVIIQPHLRFTYELLKWEEYQRQRRNEPLRRELEWATVAREIALMNKPYCS